MRMGRGRWRLRASTRRVAADVDLISSPPFSAPTRTPSLVAPHPAVFLSPNLHLAFVDLVLSPPHTFFSSAHAVKGLQVCFSLFVLSTG